MWIHNDPVRWNVYLFTLKAKTHDQFKLVHFLYQALKDFA